MATFNRPVVSLPGQERIARHPRGGRILVHATGEETGGAFGAWETFSAPGTGPTRHTHARETEMFRVIVGTYRFWCADEVFDAPVGTTVFLPPHVPHHWRNISDALDRMMGVVTPGGFEQFFVELERSGADTPEKILAIQEHFGLIEG
jgi:quercetin dioxygenase-like cupin family protein